PEVGVEFRADVPERRTGFRQGRLQRQLGGVLVFFGFGEVVAGFRQLVCGVRAVRLDLRQIRAGVRGGVLRLQQVLLGIVLRFRLTRPGRRAVARPVGGFGFGEFLLLLILQPQISIIYGVLGVDDVVFGFEDIFSFGGVVGFQSVEVSLSLCEVVVGFDFVGAGVVLGLRLPRFGWGAELRRHRNNRPFVFAFAF